MPEILLGSDQPPAVQEAVRRVMVDIGQIGVGKEGYNEQQRYRFRGIDQFVDSLSPILSKHGVIMLPNVGKPRVSEHPTKQGGTQFMVILRVQWTIVGPRGDSLYATTIGQALDSSDKAANKAMSAAYKYVLGQVFTIPNIGWAEQDGENPEVGHDQPQGARQQPRGRQGGERPAPEPPSPLRTAQDRVWQASFKVFRGTDEARKAYIRAALEGHGYDRERVEDLNDLAAEWEMADGASTEGGESDAPV